MCTWLEDFGLGQYVIFARQWVTSGHTLLTATPQDMEKVRAEPWVRKLPFLPKPMPGEVRPPAPPPPAQHTQWMEEPKRLPLSLQVHPWGLCRGPLPHSTQVECLHSDTASSGGQIDFQNFTSVFIFQFQELGIKHPLHRKKLVLAVKAINTKQEEKSALLDHIWVTRKDRHMLGFWQLLRVDRVSL